MGEPTTPAPAPTSAPAAAPAPASPDVSFGGSTYNPKPITPQVAPTTPTAAPQTPPASVQTGAQTAQEAPSAATPTATPTAQTGAQAQAQDPQPTAQDLLADVFKIQDPQARLQAFNTLHAQVKDPVMYDSMTKDFYNRSADEKAGVFSGFGHANSAEEARAAINARLHQEAEPKFKNIQAGLAKAGGGLGTFIGNNPMAMLLPLGLLGMMIGGRTGKLLGALAMGLGGYSLYNAYKGATSDTTKTALEVMAGDPNADVTKHPKVVEQVTQEIAQERPDLQAKNPQEFQQLLEQRLAEVPKHLQAVSTLEQLAPGTVRGQFDQQVKSMEVQPFGPPEGTKVTTNMAKFATLADSANLYSTFKAQREILEDPSLSVFGKGKMMTAIQLAAAHQDEPKPWFTTGDLVRGAIGAGIGKLLANTAARFLGVSDETKSQMNNLGMGLGTVLNLRTTYSGFQKQGAEMSPQERDARNAFLLGAVQALQDAGYFTKAANFAATLPLTPDLIARPIEIAGTVTRAGSDLAGSIAGAIAAPDDADKDAEKAEFEAAQLNRQAEILKGQRANRLLAQVLKRRLRG